MRIADAKDVVVGRRTKLHKASCSASVLLTTVADMTTAHSDRLQRVSTAFDTLLAIYNLLSTHAPAVSFVALNKTIQSTFGRHALMSPPPLIP
jgi:hypothetical protein